MAKNTKTAAATTEAGTNGAAPKAPRAKKDGLRKPQIRILQLLSDGVARTRGQISEKAPVDLAFCTSYIGSDDPDARARNDKKMFPSLRTLGYVKVTEEDNGSGEKKMVHRITSSGRKALEKVLKETETTV